MLLKIVQSSFRSIYSAELLRTVNLTSINKCRYGTRWTSRKPVAIVNENELFDTNNDTEEIVTNVSRKTRRPRKRSNKQEKEEKEKEKEIVVQEVENKADSIKSKYKILEADDKLIRCVVFYIIHK